MLASRGEIKIHEILEKAGLNFKEEYSFAGLNSRRRIYYSWFNQFEWQASSF